MKDRKEKIIDAMLELAAENGSGTVSMQQIADRTGITKASLYSHFSSRDEIVEAMYERIRQASRGKTGGYRTDYERLAGDASLKEILTEFVRSCRQAEDDPGMRLFHRIVMSERYLNRAAAEIAARETKDMIHSARTLFYALQVKGIACFDNADAAAFSFVMGMKAITEHLYDLELAGMKANADLMRQYIEEFSRAYDSRGKEGRNAIR